MSKARCIIQVCIDFDTQRLLLGISCEKTRCFCWLSNVFWGPTLEHTLTMIFINACRKTLYNLGRLIMKRLS